MKSCLAMIAQKYDSLSYSERLFADFIMKNREKAVNMPISELSESLKIAQSTIVATTKELGFSGWKEFRICLAAELVNPIESWQQKENEIPEKPYQRVISSNVMMLGEITRSIDFQDLEKASEYIINADKISIFGIGTSNILAHEAFDYFFRLGLPVEVYSDWHYKMLSLSRLTKDSLAIFFSQSGVNKDIISLASKARKTGCGMIGISNYKSTPFSKFMDIHLAPLSALEKNHDNHFALRIPIIAIIEILYYMIAEKMGSRYKTELAMTYDVVNESFV